MLAVIDNYDSFTFNLVQYLAELGADVEVFRNDQISVQALAAKKPSRLLLSPGPGRPDDAGITLDAIDHFAGQIPILGVCLGHQSIGQYFGGRIIHAGQIMHGKLSSIYHHNEGVFEALDNGYAATRYHSLVIDKNALPDCLEMTAWTQRSSEQQTSAPVQPDHQQIDEIMGIRHKTLAVEGVQFHPESISSEFGHQLLKNFLRTGESQ